MTGGIVPPVHWLESIGSTNAEALRLIRAGDLGPAWIVAERQTSGRGRSGRKWASEPGNIYASLRMPVSAPPAALPQLSFLAGIAVFEAVVAAMGAKPPGLRLKWPNDVLIGRAKLAGILVEATTVATESVAVLGIGINLAWAPDDLGREVTCLARHGGAPSPRLMHACLASALTRWLATWADGAGFAAVRSAWSGASGTLGEPISVNTGNGLLTGCYRGLAESGALQLEVGGGRIETIDFGDVTILPRGSEAS